MELILLFLFAAICEVFGTLGGFGSSVMFVPIANFFFAAKLVLALTSILHVFSNAAKVFLFRRHIDKKIFLLFGIPSLLLTIVGAILTNYLSHTLAEWILAVFLILFSIFFLVYPEKNIAATNLNAVGTGSLAGFFAGFVGTGGAIRGMCLAAYNLEKQLFVGTSSAIDFGVDFSRMLIYLKNGYFKPQYYIYVPVLFVASLVGSYLGKYFLKKISQENFKKFVLVVILGLGITMIVQLTRGN